MNIQKVTASGWEMYLAKYVAKSEPSFQLNMRLQVKIFVNAVHETTDAKFAL